MGASRIYLTVLLLPATKLRQCNVFTPVCHSVHGGVVCNTPLWADPPGQTRLPSGADTPRQTPPPTQCMLAYGQQAVGTHPTGMHSCLVFENVKDILNLDKGKI